MGKFFLLLTQDNLNLAPKKGQDKRNVLIISCRNQVLRMKLLLGKQLSQKLTYCSILNWVEVIVCPCSLSIKKYAGWYIENSGNVYNRLIVELDSRLRLRQFDFGHAMRDTLPKLTSKVDKTLSKQISSWLPLPWL